MGIFKKREVADIYLGLREQALLLDPGKIGLESDASNSLFGILMETGYEDAVVTLTSIADGTVSLYFSNGGGIIGLGGHEGPRKACLSFLSRAKEFISHGRQTKEFPLPKNGRTIFYFLTTNGVLAFEAEEDDLGNNKLPLSPLFHKAQEVITEARLVDEERRRNFAELMHAVINGDIDKVRAMISDGADINATDPSGLNPVMGASYSGNADVLKLLIKEGAAIDNKDSAGYTALMFACNAGQLSCANMLIHKGANVNETDKDGSTPLMFCSRHGHNDIVKLLLGHGADPAIKGKHGLTAIGFARQNGLRETEKILQEK